MALPMNFKQHFAVSKSATGATASTSVAFKIFWVGDKSQYTGEPGVFLDISEMQLTFYTRVAATAVVDSTIGTAGVLTAVATDTLAATVALINASKNWRAVPCAMLSTDVWGTAGANLAADIAAAAITDAGTSVCLKTIISDGTNGGVVSVCLGLEAAGSEVGFGPSRRSGKKILGFRNDPAAAVPAVYPRQTLDMNTILQSISVTQPSTKMTGAYLDIYDATDTGETKVVSAKAITDTNSAVTSYTLSDTNNEVMSLPGHRLVARVEASGIGSATTAVLTLSGVVGELI
jgi:hypothetical protein